MSEFFNDTLELYFHAILLLNGQVLVMQKSFYDKYDIAISVKSSCVKINETYQILN